jgi:chromosome segregation ATPase
VDEEVVLLEEQLSAAHADIRSLEARLAAAESKASGHETEAAELRDRLDAVQREVEERDGVIATQSETIATAIERARQDATRYREVALAREPDLPADLVHGDTVDAIEEALGAARQTVAQVRQHLEQQAQAIRVPTGAPVRAAPDLSGLSSAEKIRLGLQQS